MKKRKVISNQRDPGGFDAHSADQADIERLYRAVHNSATTDPKFHNTQNEVASELRQSDIKKFTGQTKIYGKGGPFNFTKYIAPSMNVLGAVEMGAELKQELGADPPSVKAANKRMKKPGNI